MVAIYYRTIVCINSILKVLYNNTIYSLFTFPGSIIIELKIIQLFKTVFNFTGGIRLNIEIIYFMLPLTMCKSIAFTQAAAFLIYRTSLMLCLFYKVRILYRHNLAKAINRLSLLGFGLFLILLRIGIN